MRRSDHADRNFSTPPTSDGYFANTNGSANQEDEQLLVVKEDLAEDYWVLPLVLRVDRGERLKRVKVGKSGKVFRTQKSQLSWEWDARKPRNGSKNQPGLYEVWFLMAPADGGKDVLKDVARDLEKKDPNDGDFGTGLTYASARVILEKAVAGREVTPFPMKAIGLGWLGNTGLGMKREVSGVLNDYVATAR